jgi:hypothetical protein
MGLKSCSLVDVNRRFGRKYCIHLQGRKVNKVMEKEKFYGDDKIFCWID